MTHIESIEQIRELVAAVRAKRQGFITNFFLDEGKHKLWIDKDVFFYKLIGETVFFIKNDSSFSNAFYSSTSYSQLAADLNVLNTKVKGKLIFDIIGRDIQCEPVIRVFRESGYSKITSLKRMSRVTPKESYSADEGVVYAAAVEVDEVSAILHNNFNEETEQIPYLEELISLARNQQILLFKVDGSITGVLVFEKNASTLYLRYWFTNPENRENKIGSKLLRTFFSIGESTKRQQLWVNQTNENAIKIYEHYGFTAENMFDYVMINK